MSVASFQALANKFVIDTFSDFTKAYVFESMTRIPDDQGGYTESWSTFATITGFVKPTSGDKIILDDHIKTKNLKMFSFQYVSGITDEMRILYNTNYYNIHSVASIQESAIWIDVIASESVAT
tara:strand:- start:3469 stop:3837 length:369 start_codon:yes stop_codon:yes gene_type:complete